MKYMNYCILALGILCASCGLFDEGEGERTAPRELTTAEKSLVSSDNKFGLKLFRALSEADPDSNLFISPLSISMALGMTLNGAADSTYEAMKNTLELAGLTETEINESYQSLIELLTTLDPEVTLSIANSIWYRDDWTINEEFLNTNQMYFNAQVRALDFADPNSVDIINDWVRNETNDLIEKIIKMIPANALMYLINAVYFKGNWTYQFDPELTKDGIFHNASGAISMVPMMEQDITLPIAQTDQFTALDIPYGDSLFTMTIFLPHDSLGINSLAKNMNPMTWNEWTNSFTTQQVTLVMPKFELEWEKELKNILSALGMAVAFDQDKANFSRMAPIGFVNLYISKVKHKTFIQVDEEGTEAAAVTAVEISFTSVPPKIVIDRPFILAIRENHSGTILFIGKIVQL